ncbi:MAG: ClpXP protease specificity-enhancing factor [Acidiferrobacterales bacterium]
MPAATSTRPYLIRAIYDWAIDNGFTPHVLVDAKVEGVSVPMAYVRDGKIALNIHPQAINGLDVGKDHLLFSARFSGNNFEVVVPVDAVLAIFARENGRGFFFQDEPADDTNAPGDDCDPPPSSPGNRPSRRRTSPLKLVK